MVSLPPFPRSELERFDDDLKSCLTLGQIIGGLSAMPSGALVSGYSGLGSYRGYYEMLAWEGAPEPVSIGAMLNEARRAVGGTFEGYKGGEYTMGGDTPVWIANYGELGYPFSGTILIRLYREANDFEPETQSAADALLERALQLIAPAREYLDREYGDLCDDIARYFKMETP